MATVIGEILVNLRASTAAFAKDLSKLEQLSFNSAKAIERSWNLVGTAMAAAVNTAAVALAVGIQKTAEWEVNILHLAASAGTTVETMSGLSFVAKEMGLEIDQVALALERFDKQLVAAQLGNAKASQNISLLGLDPKQIKSSDDALLQLADHFARMPDGIVKTGEAMLAFGKAGAVMVPLLNLGRKGMQDFLDEAKAMGVVITKEQAEDAEVFEQNIARMKEALHGLWVEITNATLPVLDDLSAHFLDTKKNAGFAAATSEFLSAIGFGPALGGGGTSLDDYLHVGMQINDMHAKMATTVKDVSAATVENIKLLAEHQKAVETLEKSIKAIIDTQKTELATVGLGSEAIQEYKIRTDAAKLGISGWAEAEIALYRAQNTRLDVMQKIAEIDSQTKAEEKLIAQQDAQKLLQDQIASEGQLLDVLMKVDVTQFHMQTTAPQLTFKLSDVKGVLSAWKQVGDVVDKSLNDMIFSGKSFTQVLSDITKMLGEMFLKWSLFGFGDKNTAAGGGIMGALFGGLSGLFGGGGGLAAAGSLGNLPVLPMFAAGGDTAGGPMVVGESGPEVFYPGMSGKIVPNNALGGPTVNYYIDARGSSITEEQFRRSMADSENRAVQRSLNMGRESQLRT